MDAPTSACPNCGTPRGPYDRFCTGCAADLGAPGSPIGVVGTLGVMNVAGPSSGQARAPGHARAPTAPSFQRVGSGWVVPGVRTPSYAPASTGPLRQVGTPSATTGATGGASRLWRTLATAGRLFAILDLLIMLAVFGLLLSTRPTPDVLVGWLEILILFFGLPSLLLLFTASRVERGEPSWIRSLALIEMLVVLVATFGVAIVPLALIFVLAGEET